MAGFMDYFTGGGNAGAGFDMFGANASGMNDLLTAQQQEAIKRQSMMAMAAQLLQAGGRSPQRTSLGQALGQGLMAGQQAQQAGTTGAVNQMLLRGKLDEMKRAQSQREQMNKLLMGDAGEEAPIQAINAPVAQAGPFGPTVQRADMIPMMGQAPAGGPAGAPAAAGGGAFSFLSPTQRALMAGLPADQQGTAMMSALSGRQKFGAPQTFSRDGKPVTVQLNEFGEERVIPDTMPYEAPPSAVKEYEYAVKQGFPGTFQQFDTARKKAGASSVTVPIDVGQKGFENERGLGKDFRAEPIYKDFSDMQTAYTQVVSSLKQGTPIGDVAGATKVMKLLDPGSVVRESELGIAMAAGGRMDRLQNYFSNMMSGQKLTPQQRDDFERLSNELYAAAGQAYNQKRAEYLQMGDAYGFKNLGTVLGKPASIPSIMRQPSAAPAPGTPARPSLGNIFGGSR
jgi:hypothetical protein